MAFLSYFPGFRMEDRENHENPSNRIKIRFRYLLTTNQEMLPLHRTARLV